MPTKDYTHTDYFSASLARIHDSAHLQSNKNSIIFSVYCAGVAIECMFRAYITRYTKEFDSKHNLEKLYIKSQIANTLQPEEKEKMTIAVRQANRLWSNDLRYSSELRVKRFIAHELVKTKYKDVNKFITYYYSPIFTATELIINTGTSKWI